MSYSMSIFLGNGTIAADDNVLYDILSYLDVSDALHLAISSSLCCRRLVGDTLAAETPEEGCLQRFLADILGKDAVAAAAACGIIAAMQALRGPPGEVVSLTLAMDGDTPVPFALRFLDAIFAAEHCWQPASLAAAQQLLRANWANVMSATRRALKAVEQDFDAVVAEEFLPIQNAYVRVARLRSAVAFLQERFGKWSRQDLEDAVASLDLTIKGYVEEGFDLGCPQVNRPGKAAMPYSHWWVHRVHRVSNDFGLCS
mmetsp:Transcript_37979/g.81657  ORF Transcript_37979/g.81657 Transcript_37979/m.81657 type:complete len:257 (+) Transcript_37979:2-772(+)